MMRSSTRRPERGNRAGPIEKAEVKKRRKFFGPHSPRAKREEEEEEEEGGGGRAKRPGCGAVTRCGGGVWFPSSTTGLTAEKHLARRPEETEPEIQRRIPEPLQT